MVGVEGAGEPQGGQLHRKSAWGRGGRGDFLTKTSVSGPKLNLQGIFLPLVWMKWSRLHYSQDFMIAQDLVTGHRTSPCDPDIYVRFSNSKSSPLLSGPCFSLT